ncbi:TRAP transporter small permease [Altererythrobacter aquiaggeris]|uniref:TRAP transporter small permease n=1 Tax=Aestuarierythrobacter aquiaggeris TaxID=1898396 RepID=UPI00301A6104
MRQISDLLIKLGAAGLILMTAIIGWQVFGRFVLDASPSWSEQTALILMIWYVFFAAAAGVYEGFHIRISLFESQLSDANAHLVRNVIQLLVAGGGIILLVYGAQLSWLVRDHTIPVLGISRGLAYIPIPLCGLLIALFALNHLRQGAIAGPDENQDV